MTAPHQLPPELPAKRGPVAWMAGHSVAANLVMLTCLIGGLISLVTVMKKEVFPDIERDAIRAGWSVDRTRKSLMLLATVMSPAGIFAVFADSLFWTMAPICFAIFFWIFWSVTVHTLPGDYFPSHAVASVYGIGGTGSTVGSVISVWIVGLVLDLTHSYVPVFVGLGLVMPVAFVVGTTLMRRVEPVQLRED